MKVNRPIKSTWHPLLRDRPVPGESPFDWIELPAGLELPAEASVMTLNEIRSREGQQPYEHPDASRMTHEQMVSKWWKHAIRNDEL